LLTRSVLVGGVGTLLAFPPRSGRRGSPRPSRRPHRTESDGGTMKKLVACTAALLVCAAAFAHADTAKSKQPAAMDPKEMQEMMMKLAAPGPQHEQLKKLVGDWTAKVTTQMDPSQPAEEAQSSSSISALMDGRYFQEQVTGQMAGMPFSGMGITGY